MGLTLVRATAFALTVALWNWAARHSFSPVVNGMCVVGTVLAVFPTVWMGRRVLDREPTVAHAARVTSAVHAILMVLLGLAIIKAIQTADRWRGILLPVPDRLGMILAVGTGVLALLTVVNLAVRGLGAPFSIALSRRLATDWMYARTRNPMVLATIAWLVAMGLWKQSALFVVWVLALVTPAWIAFLRVYEERELEIRFGDAYRAYRARTSFLLP